jgi:hypothetical protein
MACVSNASWHVYTRVAPNLDQFQNQQLWQFWKSIITLGCIISSLGELAFEACDLLGLICAPSSIRTISKSRLADARECAFSPCSFECGSQILPLANVPFLRGHHFKHQLKPFSLQSSRSLHESLAFDRRSHESTSAA